MKEITFERFYFDKLMKSNLKWGQIQTKFGDYLLLEKANNDFALIKRLVQTKVKGNITAYMRKYKALSEEIKNLKIEYLKQSKGETI